MSSSARHPTEPQSSGFGMIRLYVVAHHGIESTVVGCRERPGEFQLPVSFDQEVDFGGRKSEPMLLGVEDFAVAGRELREELRFPECLFPLGLAFGLKFAELFHVFADVAVDARFHKGSGA